MSGVTRILKQTIEENNLNIECFNIKIEEIQVQIDSLYSDNKECISYIQANCSHPNSIRKDGIFMSGGYDHVSEQPYTIVCTECNKVLKSKCIRGTYA